MAKRVHWNADKAEANWDKHHVRFEEAETVFHDPLAVILDDTEHSIDEDRFWIVGESRWHPRLLVVAYTVRGDGDAWLIMARPATFTERRRYMRGDRIREQPDEELNLEDFPEVDFTNGVRGLHYIPMTVTRVSIEDDVARYFSDDASVNAALRMLIAEGRAPAPRNE